MHDLVVLAVSRTFGFSGWKYANEFEFKHELFHRLASLTANGIGLAQQVPRTPSCRLHAEGKVLNGYARKADLLICDPRRRQSFNYEVEYVIELKRALTARTVAEELEKFRSYGRVYKALYLIAPSPSNARAELDIEDPSSIHLLHPGILAPIQGSDFIGNQVLDLDDALTIVERAIDDTLGLYGRGREQYHSFFWCNYEHETWRKHSFPSEGDFNAHLYHALRQLLPATVEIRSEVHPPGESKLRVDFVICDGEGRWAIPIEVKMNWDQFKPAYRNGSVKTAEASLIIHRLQAIAAAYPLARPVLVVIQGEWQLPRDIRSRALPLLEASEKPLELVMYDEQREMVVRRILCPGR